MKQKEPNTVDLNTLADVSAADMASNHLKQKKNPRSLP